MCVACGDDETVGAGGSGGATASSSAGPATTSSSSASGSTSGSGGSGGDASSSGAGGAGGGSEACAALASAAAELEADGFSGALGVMRGGVPLLWTAHGTCIRESGTPCDVSTVFDIGSITKQATAAAILALQEDGALSVDDTLDAHFPDVPEDKAGITLHQLLTHSSGVAEGIGDDYDPVGREAWLAQAFAEPLAGEPGEYLYSNVGYSILTAIIEAQSETDYESYLAERLFGPAGLTHTGYVLPSFDDVVVAHGYSGDETMGAPNAQPWDATGPWWNLRGNGGLLSDLADMAAWDEALRGDQILGAAAKEAMYTPWVDEGFGDSFYGYGWVVIDVPGVGKLVTHNGGNDYFFADYFRFLDADLTVIVLDNAVETSHEEIGVDLATIALSECD
jgi:CubicO group peptidase (beta-lactamase class C family)